MSKWIANARMYAVTPAVREAISDYVPRRTLEIQSAA